MVNSSRFSALFLPGRSTFSCHHYQKAWFRDIHFRLSMQPRSSTSSFSFPCLTMGAWHEHLLKPSPWEGEREEAPRPSQRGHHQPVFGIPTPPNIYVHAKSKSRFQDDYGGAKRLRDQASQPRPCSCCAPTKPDGPLHPRNVRRTVEGSTTPHHQQPGSRSQQSSR